MSVRSILTKTAERSIPAELTITALRVFVGLALALAHGLGKLPPSDRFLGTVRGMDFPAPELFAWAAGLSEFVGGLLLALGLLTRPAALAIACTMAVAGFVRHASDPFGDKELSFTFLCVALVFLARGGGRWSLDRVLAPPARG